MICLWRPATFFIKLRRNFELLHTFFSVSSLSPCTSAAVILYGLLWTLRTLLMYNISLFQDDYINITRCQIGRLRWPVNSSTAFYSIVRMLIAQTVSYSVWIMPRSTVLLETFFVLQMLEAWKVIKNWHASLALTSIKYTIKTYGSIIHCSGIPHHVIPSELFMTTWFYSAGCSVH